MKYPVEIVKAQYVYLKLIPNNSIKNNETHYIARTISNMYKSLAQQRTRTEEKLFNIWKKEIAIPLRWKISKPGKIGYFIYMEKEKVEFYFLVPTHFYDVLKDRIRNTWKGITIEKVDTLPQFREDAYKYQMVYAKEDGLSLATNRANNDLLNANLNVIDMLEEGDKIGILYNFIPISQNGFKYSYNSTLEKVKSNKPTDRNKINVTYMFKMGFSVLDGIIKAVAEALAGKSVAKTEESLLEGMLERMNGGRQVSESTHKKIKGQILNTQILILTESKANVRVTERSYATAVAQSFDVISGDNRLIGEHYTKGKIDFHATNLPGVKINKIFDEEGQHFISLPGRELLEQYKFINKIDTQETPIPEELQKGIMCIGKHTIKGVTTSAYLTEHEQFKKLALLLIGPSRAGKSNLIAHLCIDAIENNECVIIIDYIKKCELSKNIARLFPTEKVKVIDCRNPEKLQGLGYNEVGVSDDPFKRYENAKKQTSNTLALVNAINDGASESSRLSPKMERFLESACLLVYCTGGSINDIFSVLLNHEVRYSFLRKINNKQLKEYLTDYLYTLQELDDKKDGEVIGSKFTKVEGIIDRLNSLKRNTFMELMLKKSIKENIDFSEEFQKNQVILIQMPEAAYPTDGEKDILTTYWLTKFHLALLVRADKYDESKLKKVNLVIDEIYQVHNATKFFTSKLSQIAKFGMKPIISCHYIGQLKELRQEFKSANTSYMFLAGSEKSNYKEFKEELYPFDLEDFTGLKTYTSMNYIKTKDGYSSFISELPEEVIKRKRKQLKQS